MASFKPRELVSILQKLGFIKKRQAGSHLVMYNPESKIAISVPMHSKDIKRGLLLGIVKQAHSSERVYQIKIVKHKQIFVQICD